jgi:hypothetical protein
VRVRAVIPIATVLTALAIAAPAAAQVTVGQVATKEDFGVCGFVADYDEIVTAVATGTSYAVPPPGGLITSWTTTSWIPAANQRPGLKVFRPAGPNTYTALAEDDRDITPMSTNTFPASIPVQAGDLVGLHIPGFKESPEKQLRVPYRREQPPSLQVWVRSDRDTDEIRTRRRRGSCPQRLRDDPAAADGLRSEPGRGLGQRRNGGQHRRAELRPCQGRQFRRDAGGRLLA